MALPPIEYRLLCLLASNAGKVITYGHLLTEVWGPEYYGEDIHILEAAIARLRRRLGDGAGDRNYICHKAGHRVFLQRVEWQLTGLRQIPGCRLIDSVFAAATSRPFLHAAVALRIPLTHGFASTARVSFLLLILETQPLAADNAWLE